MVYDLTYARYQELKQMSSSQSNTGSHAIPQWNGPAFDDPYWQSEINLVVQRIGRTASKIQAIKELRTMHTSLMTLQLAKNIVDKWW